PSTTLFRSHVRHVFHRRDPRDHALVTVTAGHLVAGLQTTLNGQVHLDHLQYARRQLVTLRQLLALLFEGKVELVAFLLQRFFRLLQNDRVFFVGQTNVKPLPAVQIRQVFLRQRRALGQLTRTTVDSFANQEFTDPIKGIVFNNTQLVIQVLTIAAQFVVDNGLGALVAFDAFTR